MESNVNKNGLKVNKMKIDQGNKIIGTHNEIVDANIISFEHALEKIQNKLSLPEYDGPDDFEESYDNKYYSGNVEPSSDNEFGSLNIMESVVNKMNNTSNVMQNTQKKTIYPQNLKVMKHWKSIKSYSSLKQMTLDKYAFQTQSSVLKSPPKTSCSIMFACSSSSISFDNKSYTHDKVLFWKNPSVFQDESIVPSILRNISFQSEENMTSQFPQYVADKTAVKGVESNQNQFDVDPLELEIEKAMKKYDIAIENNVENANVPIAEHSAKNDVSMGKDTEYVESGVQTIPLRIHACNCLGYHVCDMFRGLDDGQCTKKRQIDALDLDTLRYVPKKKFSSDIIQNEGRFINDQEVPQYLNDNQMFPQQHKSLEIVLPLTKFSKVSNKEDGGETRKEKESSPADQGGSSKTDRKSKSKELQVNIKQKCKNSSSEFSFDSYHCDTLYPTEEELNNLKILSPQENQKENHTQLSERRQEIGLLQNNCIEEILNENVSKKENINSDVSVADNFNKLDNGNYSSLENYEESKISLPAYNWANYTEEQKMLPVNDQDVPDIIDELKVPDELESEDSVLWNSSFQWKSNVQKPHEEFLDLKPLPQKVRRIGLSRRDKPISLHPKRRRNF